MSRISELSDELLIKILSYLPTKVAASTMILSKQWQFLWMWLPNLEFRSKSSFSFGSSFKSDLQRLGRFLLRNLPLHRAPVIESFHLSLNNLDRVINPEDVKLWVLFAVSRDVRELAISYSSAYYEPNILPNSLYTCKTLMTLKLGGCSFRDVPRMVCLPFLKTLQLEDVSFDNNDSLPWLLSNFPVLEDLSLYELYFGDVGKMIVRVPSLQRLSLYIINYLDEFMIDTPSLKYLKLKYAYDGMYTSMNMPKLKEAFLDVSFTFFGKLIGSIPSVKRLTLCLSYFNMSEVVFDDGFVFDTLKHLKLCTCEGYLANLLVQLLKVSPNLRALELFKMNAQCHWRMFYGLLESTSIVPECLLSSLETFKWSTYYGSKEERELVIYILQNSRRLKTATVLLYEDLDKAIIKELELSSRASTSCQLLFR